MHVHKTHSDIINRLKRAHGHLSKIISMIEEKRQCSEVAQQMEAVCRALLKAKTIFVQDHINGCFDESELQDLKKAKEKMKELKNISKYL